MSPIFIPDKCFFNSSAIGSGDNSKLSPLSSIPRRYLHHPAIANGIAINSLALPSFATYDLIVSPYRIPTFCEVSVAILCGVSGIKGLGILTLRTSSTNFCGEIISGLITTGIPSDNPIRLTSSESSLSFISSAIRLYPNKQPYTAKAVCNGLRQVVTFIRSTLLTVCLSVIYTPAFSS